MGLLYGALITFIPTIKSSLPAPLTALLSSPVPDTPVTEPPAERTAAEPPSKRDRKLWKLNFSAMKRKLLGRSAKAPGADGGVLLYGYYQMNDQKWAALRQLKEEVDARPELRRHAREVQHELTELTLLRFLEVSYWRVEKDGDAGPRLVDVIARTVEWRDQMGAVAMAPAAVRAPAAAGKLYVRGADRQGRPVIHFRPAREHAPFDVAANTRLVVYTLERALRAMPPGQSRFAVVVDCAGFTLGNFPPVAYIKEEGNFPPVAYMKEEGSFPPVAYIKEARLAVTGALDASLGVMMNHYPMRLGYVRIVNAGRGLNFFWKIIASMLQERTTKKISFLGGPATCDALLSELPPQALPDTICGTDTWTYDVDQYLF
ncbi:hypothetical protein JKP88DRAFT_353248 [Tribonema minus]|uniref:CRAL-TRIO domain-containing protein n=1 Tax=Tribonema minus TaxID=303371 RepID=A0A835Z968_9STRA|nr:hypothetical protein JKP88DRAFT_353248 [Tribonema minus]